jgi:hypothetical protein
MASPVSSDPLVEPPRHMADAPFSDNRVRRIGLNSENEFYFLRHSVDKGTLTDGRRSPSPDAVTSYDFIVQLHSKAGRVR